MRFRESSFISSRISTHVHYVMHNLTFSAVILNLLLWVLRVHHLNLGEEKVYELIFKITHL